MTGEDTTSSTGIKQTLKDRKKNYLVFRTSYSFWVQNLNLSFFEGKYNILILLGEYTFKRF